MAGSLLFREEKYAALCSARGKAATAGLCYR